MNENELKIIEDTDMDSLFILPLYIVPLQTPALRSSRMVKNGRLQSVIEIFRDTQTGSGQVDVEDLPTMMGWEEGRVHPDLAILPLLESAVGFRALDEIAAAPRVNRLLFGTIDFQVDTGITSDGEELSYFRSQMTLASRFAGIGTPVDGVTTSLDDARPIEEAARRARRFGFGGKLCIHPKQIFPTHMAFTPTSEEYKWARRVIDAAEASAGSATVVDGKMIDAPVIERAQVILGAAR